MTKEEQEADFKNTLLETGFTKDDVNYFLALKPELATLIIGLNVQLSIIGSNFNDEEKAMQFFKAIEICMQTTQRLMKTVKEVNEV